MNVPKTQAEIDAYNLAEDARIEQQLARSLKSEWWKYPLPRAIGDPRNFVMTLPQMKVYEAVLAKMNETLSKEWDNVRRGVKALENRHYLGAASWAFQLYPPQPVTLNRVLTFIIELQNMQKLLLQTSTQLITSNTRKEHPCTADADTPATPGTTA